MQRLAAAGLGAHVPALIDFDERDGTLTRDFVDGPSGHDLLTRMESRLPPPMITELRVIWMALRDFQAAEGCWMDIHPGNFYWRGDDWCLADCGPIPELAAVYYAADDFDAYYDAVWARRLSLMRDVPIRSARCRPTTV